VSWERVAELLTADAARTMRRSTIGLAGIGGRAPGLYLAKTDRKYVADCVHLRWQVEPAWGYPLRGFRLYRRDHAPYRERGRRNQPLPEATLRDLTVDLTVRLVGWLVTLLRRLGGESLSGFDRRSSSLRLDQPGREIELTLARDFERVTVEGWDRGRRTLITELVSVQAGHGYRLEPPPGYPAPVVDRLGLSVSVHALARVTYTPIALDVLQWPEGTLATWGRPIAHLRLPAPERAADCRRLLQEHGIPLDATEPEIDGDLRTLLYESAAPMTDVLNAPLDRVERMLRGSRYGNGRGESARMRPLDQLALLTMHPALAEFLGFAWRDDLSARKSYERFDYLVVADWGDDVVTSAADYGLGTETVWPLRSPVVRAATLTDRSVPGPSGYVRQARIDLGRDDHVLDRERAPLFWLRRDGAAVGEGLPQPYPVESPSCFDSLGEPGVYRYAAEGLDLFGRRAALSPAVDLGLAAGDLPAPPAPARVSAAWVAAEHVYRVSWLWSPERRRLFPDADRFQVAWSYSPDGTVTDVGAAVPLAAALSVTIAPSAAAILDGNLTAVPLAHVPGAGGADAQETARALERRIEAAGLTGLIGVTVPTNLAVAEAASGILAPHCELEIRRDGTWDRFQILDHTVGDPAVFIVVSPPGHPWAAYGANAVVRLRCTQPELASVWTVSGAGRRLASGVLGDASGRAFVVLAEGMTSTVLVLSRVGEGELPSIPSAGVASVAFPQSVDLAETLIPGPNAAQPVQRLAFTATALTADGRRGAASTPAVVTRVLEAVPPEPAVPSAALLSLPDVHQHCRIRVSWVSVGPGYRYEVLRISEPAIQLVLAKSAAGIDTASVRSMTDTELRAMLDAGAAFAGGRQYQVVATTAAAIVEADDTVNTAGVRLFYAVRALDAAGNRGSVSPASASVTPPDLRAPTPPTAVRARREGDRIWVSWAVSPSSDVNGYRVLRAAEATPTSPRLLPTVSPGIADEPEPLRVVNARACLPGFGASDAVDGVLGVTTAGAPEASADLGGLTLVGTTGTELQSRWASGVRVVIEATSAAGVTALVGLDAPIVVTTGEVPLDAVPVGASVTGVYPHHLVRLDGAGGLANRAELPDLRDGGVIGPTAGVLRSVLREGTRWLVELEAVGDASRRRFVATLEAGLRDSPIELRDDAIRLPYWSAGAERLRAVYVWAETTVEGDPPTRRPALGATSHLARFDVDIASWCLRPRWREGRQVAVQYRRADGSRVERLVDPGRRRLADVSAAPVTPRYYLVQARRSVGGVPIWSGLSAPALYREPADNAVPVWIDVGWTETSLVPRHRLAWRGPAHGLYRLARRRPGESAWTVLLELMPGAEAVSERRPDGTWAASAGWTRTGDIIAGTADADPSASVECRVTYRAADAAPERGSLVVAVPALVATEL
jgi:hypothetical protein